VENLIVRWKFGIFRRKCPMFCGRLEFSMEVWDFPRKFQIFSDKFNFSAELFNFPLKFQVSGGTPNVRLKI